MALEEEERKQDLYRAVKEVQKRNLSVTEDTIL